jgi:hypothetical protein
VSRHHHRENRRREHKSQNNIRYAPSFRESRADAAILDA